MNTHNSTQAVLAFQDTEFDVVDVTGQPWLRGYQIGNALEYSDGSVAVAKLFERNEAEFDDSMTQIVELDTAGGRQPVRIFSPRGCYLLGMFARTDKARDRDRRRASLWEPEGWLANDTIWRRLSVFFWR